MSLETSFQSTAKDILTIHLPTYAAPLLLPNVAIAEILNYESIEQDESLPEWCIGLFNWRGRDLPLITFESFSDPEQTYSLDSNHRIAVINTISKSEPPFYAFLIKGIPKLLRLRAPDIEDLEGVEHESERVRVLVNDEETIIPNLEYLEYKASIIRVGEQV